MQLVILASGSGKRLSHLTKSKPKCFVKIGKHRIIDYLKKNFKYFNKVIIVTGYKKKLISKEFKNYIVAKNKNFKNTNMVHSLFCAKKYIKNDIIVCYSDIIFSPKILIQMIKKKNTHMPINQSWLKTWSLRMKKNKIFLDAETLEINKKNIISLGEKINQKLPKYQFMGLIRISIKDYLKLYKYYKSLNNKKIDMTNFLNLSIKNKIIKMNYFKTSKFWFEVDTVSDVNLINNSTKLQKNISLFFK